MCVRVCLCSNWGVREGYPVCVCVCVCVCVSVPDCCAVSGVNVQSGLIWQTNRPQGGWGIDVCLCVCVCLYVCVSDRAKGREKRKRAREQAVEVKSA